MRSFNTILITAVLGLMSITATGASLYTCKKADGATGFQQLPCAVGVQTVSVIKVPDAPAVRAPAPQPSHAGVPSDASQGVPPPAPGSTVIKLPPT